MWLDCGPNYSASRVRPPLSEAAAQASRCALAPTDNKPPQEVALGTKQWHDHVPQVCTTSTFDITNTKRMHSVELTAQRTAIYPSFVRLITHAYTVYVWCCRTGFRLSLVTQPLKTEK